MEDFDPGPEKYLGNYPAKTSALPLQTLIELPARGTYLPTCLPLGSGSSLKQVKFMLQY